MGRKLTTSPELEAALRRHADHGDSLAQHCIEQVLEHNAAVEEAMAQVLFNHHHLYGRFPEYVYVVPRGEPGELDSEVIASDDPKPKGYPWGTQRWWSGQLNLAGPVAIA